MQKIIIALLLMFSSSWAQAQDALCYQKEYNPHTRKIFSSQEEYNSFRQAWKKESPGMPGPIDLMRAYSLYKKEKTQAEKLGNDKRAHCYIGCRISQQTNYHTADYVGWLKEDRDISDCNPRSHFDEEDYRATARGAQFGESQDEPATCVQACKQVY